VAEGVAEIGAEGVAEGVAEGEAEGGVERKGVGPRVGQIYLSRDDAKHGLCAHARRGGRRLVVCQRNSGGTALYLICKNAINKEATAAFRKESCTKKQILNNVKCPGGAMVRQIKYTTLWKINRIVNNTCKGSM